MLSCRAVGIGRLMKRARSLYSADPGRPRFSLELQSVDGVRRLERDLGTPLFFHQACRGRGTAFDDRLGLTLAALILVPIAWRRGALGPLASLLGVMLLDERLGVRGLLALGLILLGSWLATRRAEPKLVEPAAER